MTKILISDLKNSQLIIFNTFTNLLESNGANFMKIFIEHCNEQIKFYNKEFVDKSKETSVNFEPLLALLEHCYFSKDIFQSQDKSSEDKITLAEIHVVKYYIALLICNILVEKFQLKLNKKLIEILLKESTQNVAFELRVIFILIKNTTSNEGKN